VNLFFIVLCILLPSSESGSFYYGELMQEAYFWKSFIFHGGCPYIVQSFGVWGSSGTSEWI